MDEKIDTILCKILTIILKLIILYFAVNMIFIKTQIIMHNAEDKLVCLSLYGGKIFSPLKFCDFPQNLKKISFPKRETKLIKYA